MSGSVTNALQNGLSLVLVNSAGMGDQTGDGLAVPSDHDFLASLHTVKQRTECILGFKSSNLQHTPPCKLDQSSLLLNTGKALRALE
jgi:hypothetical protein